MVKETDYTHEFWENEIGRGTLYEEFTVVTQERDVQERRKVDGLVVLGERRRIAKRGEEPSRLNDQDLIVIQTKAERLGPYVFGQALLSPRLIRRSWRPRSLRSVLLCAADNPDLGMPLANAYTMPWCSSTEARPAEESGGSIPSTEVTSRVEVCIRPPTRRNCRRYGGWERSVGVVQERIDGALIAPAVLPGKCTIDGVLIPAWNSSGSPTLDDLQGLDVISIHGSEAAVGMYILRARRLHRKFCSNI